MRLISFNLPITTFKEYCPATGATQGNITYTHALSGKHKLQQKPKTNNMNFQECPHYDEILNVLTEGRNFEDINFEIDEIKNCKECSKERGVCELWTTLILVEHMKPQMNISDAKATIDNLNDQLGKIAIKLTRNSKTNDSDNK